MGRSTGMTSARHLNALINICTSTISLLEIYIVSLVAVPDRPKVQVARGLGLGESCTLVQERRYPRTAIAVHPQPCRGGHGGSRQTAEVEPSQPGASGPAAPARSGTRRESRSTRRAGSGPLSDD